MSAYIPAWFSEMQPSDKIAAISAIIAVISAILGIFQFGVLVWTVWVARDSARRQLRAYISAQPNWITSFNDRIAPIGKVELSNRGVTPAYELTHCIRVDAFPEPMPVGFTLPDIDGPWSTPVVLFPEKPLTGNARRDIPFSRDEIDQIRARTMRVYVYGMARYRDSFKKHRWIKFCSGLQVDRDDILKKLTCNSSEKFSDLTYVIGSVGNDAS